MIPDALEFWDPVEVGEVLDETFFAAHPHRNYMLREALIGEIDALCEETGRHNHLTPGDVGFIVARKYRSAILRDFFAVPPECRAELEAEAQKEDSCREGYFRIAFRRGWDRVLGQMDWERKGATLQ